MAYYGGESSGESSGGSSGGTTTDTTAPFFSQTNVIGTTTNTSPTITINSNENGTLTGTISSTNGTYTIPQTNIYTGNNQQRNGLVAGKYILATHRGHERGKQIFDRRCRMRNAHLARGLLSGWAQLH